MKLEYTAFLTTVFPGSEKFHEDFFNSLVAQTNKKFDVIIVNDGLSTFNQISKDYPSLNITEIQSSTSIAKNREKGIKSVIELGYTNLIFGDIDDYFSPNRIEVSLRLLDGYDVVVNDLSLFSMTGEITSKYFTHRIKNGTIIKSHFITDKNIFGLSNTAVKTKIIPDDFSFNSKLIAVDWYFFSLLILNGAKTVFTNEAWSYYRQHSENTIGVGIISKESILLGFKVKKQHYKALSILDASYNDELSKLSILKKKMSQKEFLLQLINQHLPYPLWWEEVKNI